ncbi:Serine/threonine-protein phosphatase PP2A-3 catalytic subunit -like protein [Gossypium arboreum]|uniref:Serine/threonine-protein phosphatase PP2A-3 catalytic subunit-like protein n=1 Tax=Gossypium arboreum TaxID=29729 RepID=A0A0B0PP02_GOSAR|nr:Serine/threonine-protein phosphatase PP2A-3 catalytic subunit -like protein [Gossypium arboreum]
MGAPTDSALDIDEQISQLMQCQSIMQQGIKYTSQRLDIFACAKWLNKKLSKLWPFVAEMKFRQVVQLFWCFLK